GSTRVKTCRGNNDCRPGAGRDPYAAAEIVWRDGGRLSPNNNESWLWVPACAGTTAVDAAQERLCPSYEGRLGISLVAVAVREFEGHQPCQQCGGIKLAEDGFEIANAACDGMYGRDIAVACRRQRRETEIDELAGQRRIVFHRHPGKRLWCHRAD